MTLKPKILDRYLISGYLPPFFACLGIFSVLVVMGRYIERMGTFTGSKAALGDVVAYLAYGLPALLNTILPVATLLSLLFALGSLHQRGELTAMRSAGIPPGRLWAPYYALALVITAASMAGGLTVLPRLQFESRSIYRVAIKKRDAAVTYRRDNVVAAGHDNRQFTIGWLDVEGNRLERVVMDRFDADYTWVESISARRAVYENGRWRFEEGVMRRKDPLRPEESIEEPFDVRWEDLRERPKDFAVEDKNPDDMAGRELLRRIKRLRRLGAKTREEEVSFQRRLALPFANLVVIALGIPFAIRQGRKGRIQTFAYALGASFCYWGNVSIFESFARQGLLPIIAAAWAPNTLFAGVAYWLNRKAG